MSNGETIGGTKIHPALNDFIAPRRARMVSEVPARYVAPTDSPNAYEIRERYKALADAGRRSQAKARRT